MPDPGDIFNVALEFDLLSGDKTFNIFDFLLTDGTANDSQVLTTLASGILTAYNNLLADIHDTVNDQDSIVNQLLWSGTEWVVQRYVGTVLPGIVPTNMSEALPYQTSALCEFLTTTPRVVGKKFLPIFGEDRQEAGAILGTTLAGMANFASSIIAPKGCGNGWLRYVVRTKDGDTVEPYGVAAVGLLSTQRRRKPGVGV